QEAAVRGSPPLDLRLRAGEPEAAAQRPGARRAGSRHRSAPLAPGQAERRLAGLFDRLTRRVSVLVTGSELVRGSRSDANGPFLADELTRLGLEPARITLVGDDPDRLEEAIREGLGSDLLVISGGLGPTHDDRTVQLLARAAGARGA